MLQFYLFDESERLEVYLKIDVLFMCVIINR